jgi:hypothetical protein
MNKKGIVNLNEDFDNIIVSFLLHVSAQKPSPGTSKTTRERKILTYVFTGA